MVLFSTFLCSNSDALPVEADIVERTKSAARTISDSKAAKQEFDALKPHMKTCQRDEEFILDCAILFEKQRMTTGMLEFWGDVQRLYPQNELAVRMLMRWFRRSRQMDEGLQRLYQLFPNQQTNVDDAYMALLGFSELKAFQEMDHLMSVVNSMDVDTRNLRMRYIKSLSDQARFGKAKVVADTIENREKMGSSSKKLLDIVDRRAETATRQLVTDQSDAISKLVEIVGRDPRPLNLDDGLGRVVLFTGQLGTGGAERQLTRIASEFQKRLLWGHNVGGLRLRGPIEVCVRHATPTNNSDFFLPILRKANVKTSVLNDLADLHLDDLEDVPAEVRDMLDLLPDDVLVITLKLVPFFRKRPCQVAYLWQDGGVLAAAFAALIAKVPRIVTSFRGLPPNLRPELYRPQLLPLYKSLAALDHVTFSSNSRAAAALYEEWLDLQSGSVKTIRNATFMIEPEGLPADENWWDDVVQRSPQADRTVLGVFRFDQNKRPLYWVDVAAEVIATRPDTRFVMVGGGFQFSEAQERIAALGLQDKIFLAGVREHVGFFFHKADVVMHLARMEGLPNVLIEAQLSGKPVLATPAGGTDEIVEHGVTGHILSQADDPSLDEISLSLLELLRSKDRLNAMGITAKQTAEPRFLVKSVLDKTVELFTQY